MPGSVANAAIRAYQRFISPDYNSGRGSRCASYPSCSEFTRQALESKGIEGGADGLLRVLGCGAEAHERNGRELLLNPSAEIQAEGEVARKAAAELKALAQELAPGLRAGDVDADIAFHEEWARLRDRVDVARMDRPGTDDRDHQRFLIRPKFVAEPTKTGALARVAGLVTGAVGALVGGAVGAVLGLAAGAVTGVAAAGRSLDRLEERLTKRHGDLAVREFHRKHAAISAPTAKIRDLAGSAVATLAGVAWGLPAGAVLGAVTGAAVAGRMGYALGKNALGPHPPGCACCS